MIINIERQEKPDVQLKLLVKIRRFLCHMSPANFTSIILLIAIAFTLFVLGKTYIQNILLWLENQDSIIVLIVMVTLFILVAFPVTVGYIILVCCSGYLFGITRGLVLTVIGANMGVAVAHITLKFVGLHNSIRTMTETEISKAITRVITGPLCFKIVFCTRLTPIPFGLQNTIFAVRLIYKYLI